MASDNSYPKQELRLILIGITGAGKSSSGNSILGKKVFPVSCVSQSVTSSCQKGTANIFGNDLCVIDTPGLFDTGRSEEDITKEITKCIAVSAPGPHAFILILKLKRFTKEESETVNLFKKLFGKEMMRYMIVLFSGMDSLEYDGGTLEEYLETAPENLQQLIKECNGRYAGINNRARGVENDHQVRYLIDMIKSNVLENGGNHYTTEMLGAAETQMRKREEEILKANEEHDRQQRAIIETEWRAKHDELLTQLAQKEEDIKNLERDKLQANEVQKDMDYEAQIEMLRDSNHKMEVYMKKRDEELKEILKRMEEKNVMVARDEAREELLGGVTSFLGVMWTFVKSFLPTGWFHSRA